VSTACTGCPTCLDPGVRRLHWQPREHDYDRGPWLPDVEPLPQHPAPEVPARPLAEGDEAPSAPRKWLAVAERAGWIAQLCYSRGTQIDARGRATRVCHTWSLRGKILAENGSQRRLYASWHQPAGPGVVNLVKRRPMRGKRRPGSLYVAPTVTGGEVQVLGDGQPLATIGLAPSTKDPSKMHLRRWIEGS